MEKAQRTNGRQRKYGHREDSEVVEENGGEAYESKESTTDQRRCPPSPRDFVCPPVLLEGAESNRQMFTCAP